MSMYEIERLNDLLRAEQKECQNLREALEKAASSDVIAEFLAERDLRFKAEDRTTVLLEALQYLVGSINAELKEFSDRTGYVCVDNAIKRAETAIAKATKEAA